MTRTKRYVLILNELTTISLNAYNILIDFDTEKKKKPTGALGKIPALPISNGQSASPEVLV